MKTDVEHRQKLSRVFVYGTLKRGQIRETAWPHVPTSVRPAKSRGRLYDLGSYPALVAGDDWVAGELWEFSADHMPKTLAVLDAIEDFRNRPDDLYRRVVVDCWLTDDPTHAISAFSYWYAAVLDEDDRIASNGDQLCSWPA